MSAHRRGQILGERQLPVRVTEQAESKATGESSSATKNYLPFSDDPVKQKRYVSFLQGNYEAASEVSNNSYSQQILTIAKDLHDFVKEDELKEFARVRDKFKEIPDVLKGRFTKAVSTAAEIQEENDKRQAERDQQAKAAPIKEILPAPIREQEDWVPQRLLCKRFGEKYPFTKVAVGFVFFVCPAHLLTVLATTACDPYKARGIHVCITPTFGPSNQTQS